MESKCGDVRESKLDYERDDEDEIVQLCEGVVNVSVVEHENRRQRAVSHFPKEVAQVCKDICTFFDAHEDRPSRARENAVDRVPGPESLRMLLLNAKEDADVWFYEYKLLAPREVNQRQLVAAAAELTPFAENIDGELLCTGADNHHGGVYCIGPEDDDIEGEMEAPSLATYLERYRDTILSGRLEFVEECGMIERCATQEPAKHNQLSSEANSSSSSSSSKKTKNLKGRNKK